MINNFPLLKKKTLILRTAWLKDCRFFKYALWSWDGLFYWQEIYIKCLLDYWCHILVTELYWIPIMAIALYFIFWIIIKFILTLFSLHTLSYAPPCCLSNLWPHFSLLVVTHTIYTCTIHICAYGYTYMFLIHKYNLHSQPSQSIC